MHRSRVLLVVVASLLSVAAGVAWGLGRPQDASSTSNHQSEFGQVHVRDPKAAGGAGAVEGLKARWVQQENAHPGTSDWHVSNAGRPGDIEGFADKVSAVQGETVRLYVSTKDKGYRVEAYRVGYYGGLGGRLIWKSGPLPGRQQEPPTRDRETNMIEAPWTPSLSVALSPAFPPGVYLFKLVTDGGVQSYIPLTIRDDRSTAAFLVQNAVTTWQAYNLWGGYSLYEGRTGKTGSGPEARAKVVSFDRPYSTGAGSGDFLGNEFPLISLVESLGLDVTYWTDVDLHQRPQLVARHRALLTLGHDEYWSRAMREGVEQARDKGVNIAFFGANALFRAIRLESSPLGNDRHQVNYRVARDDPVYGTDDKNITTEWRVPPLNEPESTLIGNFYECNPVKADMVVSDPSAWVFANTGLEKGDRLKGVVGPEYDRFDSSGPKNVQIMARSPVNCRGKASYSDMTYYTAPSGAGVWATGTNWWISKISEECSPLTSSTTSSTTTTFPAAPRSSSSARKTAFCPKQAVIDITENVLNLFGLGPAGRTHPSVATNLKELNAGTPSPDLDESDTSTTTRRGRTRTSSTSNYTRREPVSTEPPYSSSNGPDYTSPPYTSRDTTPSPSPTRRRGLLGGGGG